MKKSNLIMSHHEEQATNRTYPIFYRSQLGDSFCEMMAVRHLLWFSPATARLYLGSLNRRAAALILESLAKSKPPFLIVPPKSDMSVTTMHWECFCVAKWLGKETEIGWDVVNLYKGLVRGQKFSSVILRLIEEPEYKCTCDSARYKDMESVLMMCNECPALYYALESYFDRVSTEECGSKLFKNYGAAALNVSVPAYQDITFGNNEQVLEFFSVPSVYRRAEFSVNVQNEFFMKNRFPNVCFVGGGSVLASIFNTAASSKVHLVDVVTREAIIEFRIGETEKGLERLKLFPELVNYTVFAVLHEKLNDLNWVNEMIPLMPASKNPLITDITNRINSDVSFLMKVKQLTGHIASSHDLRERSIPQLLLPVLKSDRFEIFDEVKETAMLTVSDTDRICDCDFANAFYLVSCFLAFVNGKSGFNTDDLIEHIDSRLWMLARNPMLGCFLTDLFSLFFLKLNGKYLFNIDLLEKLLPVLISHASNALEGFEGILRDTLYKVQIIKFLDSNNSLEIMFSSPDNLLFEAVSKNEIGFADRIAATHPKCQTLLTTIKEMKTYVDTKSWQHASERTRDEIVLCYSDTQVKPISEIVERIVANRRLYPLDIVENDDVEQYISKLTKMSSVNWPLSQPLNNAPCFNSFFAYLDSVLPVLLSTKIGTTLADALAPKPWTLVSLLIQEREISAAKKIGDVFGLDIVESIIRYGNPSDTSESLEKYPVVRMAQGIMSNTDDELDSAIIKRFKQLPEKEQSRICNAHDKYISDFSSDQNTHVSLAHIDTGKVQAIITENDSMYQNGVSKSLCNDLLRKLLLEEPMPQEQVIDLAYRVDPSDLDLILEQVLPQTDLDALYSVCCAVNFGYCEKLELLRSIRDMGMSPFPLKTAFQQLVAQKEYEKATAFVKFFRYEIDVRQIIRSEALKIMKNNESITPLLAIAPQLRKEILESLPEKYRLYTKEEFFREIPDGWVVKETESGTLWTNREDIENVRILLDRFRQLSIDKEILDHVSAHAKILDNPINMRIGDLMSDLETFIDLMRNKSELLQFVCRQLLIFVDKINVEDCTNERLACVFINRVVSGLNECVRIRNSFHIRTEFCDQLENICNKVRALRDFLMLFPASKYETVYSFENFMKHACGEQILALCYQYDLVELAGRVRSAWNITSGVFADEYSMKVFALGVINDFSEDRRNKLSERTISIVKRYIDLFSHPSFYDPKLVEEFSIVKVESYMMEFTVSQQQEEGRSRLFKVPWKATAKKSADVKPRVILKSMSLDMVEQMAGGSSSVPSATVDEPHFYRRIQMICDVTTPFNISEEMTKALKSYLKNKAPVLERVCYFTTVGNYEKALKCFGAITEVQNKWDAFKDGIFVPALSYNYLYRLRYRIKELGQSLQFGPFLEKLLRFSIKNNMYVLTYELQIFLGRNDEAVLTAVELFEHSDNAKLSCKYVEFAETAAKADLKSDSPDRKRVVDRKTIEKYAELLPLQRRFFVYCQTKNVGNVAAFNLFKGATVAVSMTALLFRNLECELGVEMMKKCELNPIDVANQLLDILANEGDIIVDFFQMFETKAGNVFRIMVHAMITRLVTMHRDVDMALKLISKINDAEFRCLLLLELGQLEEAYSIAKKVKVYPIIPLIGRQALLQGNVSLLSMIQSETIKLSKKHIL